MINFKAHFISIPRVYFLASSTETNRIIYIYYLRIYVVEPSCLLNIMPNISKNMPLEIYTVIGNHEPC